MKQIIVKILKIKRNNLWDNLSLAYTLFFIIFVIICIYEAILFFVDNYTFLRAVYLFFILTAIYNLLLLCKNKKQSKQKNSIVLTKRSFGFKRYIGILTYNKKFLFYSLFLIYSFIFLLSILFHVYALIPYITSAFLGVFVLYKFIGGKISFSRENQGIQQRTFLKTLIFSTSLFIICIGVILDSSDMIEYKTMILLWSSFFYIAGFTYLFSDIFQNISSYITSKTFKNFLISNTYNILSFGVVSFVLMLFLWKFGILHNISSKLLSYFEPITIEQHYGSPEDKVYTVDQNKTTSITKSISEIFIFDGFSQLGSSGPEVAKLQEALSLLGNYEGELSGEFDENTKDSLTRVLIDKCDWPETTRGIFGPLAQECLNSLEVQFDVTGQEAEVGNSGIISNEVMIISDETITEPLGI